MLLLNLFKSSSVPAIFESHFGNRSWLIRRVMFYFVHNSLVCILAYREIRQDVKTRLNKPTESILILSVISSYYQDLKA